jgi:phosphopantetheinyl transferase (holo-ACP synthase)
MIGDDVVDLHDPDGDPWRLHPRFDSRVFHPSERALIATSLQPGRTRWILWALKESAYKAARKEDPTTVFSPVRFVVSLQDAASAIVCAGNRRFRASVSCGPGYVHAVAWQANDPPAATRSAVARLATGATSPRTVARRLVREQLAPALGVAPSDLAIHREARIPALWVHGRRSGADLSLSHHGRFVAFACRLPSHHGVP